MTLGWQTVLANLLGAAVRAVNLALGCCQRKNLAHGFGSIGTGSRPGARFASGSATAPQLRHTPGRRPERHLVSREIYKERRAAALAAWRAVMA